MVPLGLPGANVAAWILGLVTAAGVAGGLGWRTGDHTASLAVLAAGLAVLLLRHVLRRQRFMAELGTLRDGLCQCGAKGVLLVCNQRLLAIHGCSPDVARPGITIEQICAHSRTLRGAVNRSAAASCAAGGLHRTPSKALKRHMLSNRRVVEIAHQRLAGSGWVSSRTDTTAQHHAAAKIAGMARDDPLTGMLNRAGFIANIGAVMRDAPQNSAVLLRDLDGLRTVNDTLGEPA